MSHEYIGDSDMRALVLEILRDMQQQQWRPDYVVGLTRGGLTPAVMISHYLDIPMYSLQVSLRDNTTTSESNLWMAEDAFQGRRILVVDDINDTGATLNWIMQDWPSGCFPNDQEAWQKVWNQNVKFAVLINNVASHCKIKMDFCGQEINKLEESKWIVFPWEQWWTHKYS